MAHILAHINNHCYKMEFLSIMLMLIPFFIFLGELLSITC